MELVYVNESEEEAFYINPLDIDLVLTKIFEYLRTNTLLNTRLVNRTWNSRALEVLRSRNCAIALDATNIKDYVDSQKQTDSAPQNLANEEGDDEDGSKNSLNFSVTCGGGGEDQSKFIETTLEYANNLVELLGPKCIQSFIFKCNVKQSGDLEHSQWIRVLKLIQLIAPGLQELVICIYSKPENFTVALDVPSFPALHTLYYGQVHITPIVLTQIINSAPLLKNLTVTRKLFDTVLDGHRIASSLSAIANLSNLRALSIDAIDYLNTALSPLPLESVQELKLRIENGVYEIRTDFIGQFIRTKCPNISSLQFEFVPTSNSFTNNFPLSMPSLPRLTHLGYKVNWNHCIHQEPSFIKLDNLMTAPQKFPALQTVTTNLGSCVYLSTEFEEWQSYQLQEDQHVAWYNNPNIGSINFTSVSTLHFVINYPIDFEFHPDHIGFPISLRESINQIHLLYPSVKKLHIDNQITSLKKEEYKFILKALLEEIDGLEELVISNYDHDWLGEVLSESCTESPGVIPDLINSLQGLKVLRLPEIWDSEEEEDQDRNDSDSNSKSWLNLNMILKHIPSLEEIHVDARFLKTRREEPYEVVQARLNELAFIYPNCVVKVF